MFRRRAHRKLVAWFAMLAIGLLATAPTVSRLVAAASGAAGIGCVEHARMGQGERTDGGHADALDACGYCTLAAHGAALCDAIAYTVPAVPAAPLAVPVDRREVVVAAVRRLGARGPPAAGLSAPALA